jgi:proteasome lid subunit RPN8/RPN11
MTARPERVRIAAPALRLALAEAAASPDLEVCGLLLGRPGRIDRAVPAANVAADPSRWFEVDPVLLFRLLRAERGGGPALLGHYHSHPSGSLDPSPRDAAAAEPGRLWLILAAGQARLWRAGAGGFQSILMEPMPRAGA